VCCIAVHFVLLRLALSPLVLVAVGLVLNIRETLAPRKVGIGVDRTLSIVGNVPCALVSDLRLIDLMHSLLVLDNAKLSCELV
jgi:hypothetical protein